MTRFAVLLCFAAGAAACGSLPTTSEGVAFLEIQPPTSTTLHVGDTVQFAARTLDASGSPVDVAVTWRTPDTTITVEPATGRVIGRFTGSSRVQAVVGDEELVSNFVVLTIQAAPTGASPIRTP